MKKLKSQNGAIAIIVLVSVLFLTMFLISSYMVISNKLKTQKEVIDQTRQIYENYDLAEIYNSFFNNGVIPIYSNEQYFKIGSNEKVIISETGGKYYDFVDSANYILMNDLSINKSDYSDINWDDWQRPEEKLNGGMIDYNGHTIEFTEAIPLLPDEYSEVEYIETTGSEYIDTGVIENLNLSCEVKFMFNELGSSVSGPHLISGPNIYLLVPRMLSNGQVFVSYRQGDVTVAYNWNKNEIYEVSTINDEIIVNGEVKLKGINKATTFSSTRKVYLLTYGGSPGYSIYTFNGKLYYCKIYDGDTLVRNFIPCYRKFWNRHIPIWT